MFFLFSTASECPPPLILLLFCDRDYRHLTLTLYLRSVFLKEAYKHLESLARSNGKVDVTTVILCKLQRFDVLCIATCNPDCTNGDFSCAATRTSCACCSNCKINAKSLYCSLHHCLCHFLTNSSLLLKKLTVNAKQVFLHLIGV